MRTATYHETLSDKDFTVTIEKGAGSYIDYYVRHNGQTLGWIIKGRNTRGNSTGWNTYAVANLDDVYGNLIGSEATLEDAAWKIAQHHGSALSVGLV